MSNAKLWLGALAIGALAIGCGSNRNTGTQGTTGTSGSTDVNGGATMTLRGCVENGVPAGTYVLKTIGSAEGTEGNTAATSGSKEPSGSDVNGVVSGERTETTYRLIPTGSLDPGENLGKEVSVTGELATEEPGNTPTTGTSGPGSAATVPPKGQRPAGNGGAGTNLENGGSNGSGGGRVHGNAPDESAGAKFFRVTSMTKVSESCPLPSEGGKE